MNKKPPPQIKDAISLLKQQFKIKKNSQIVVLTGSGISKGSGIPTFRGKDGLWKNYNAQDLATPQAFARDPELVWEWYSWRIGLIQEKKPNPAHFAVKKLQENGYCKWIITQNVDNLHQRARSTNILQVHGNIFKMKCEQCGNSESINSPPKSPPICRCGSLFRPAVVWFGESLNHAILKKIDEILRCNCDILLIIGTSGIVYPIAAYPMQAKQNGSIIIEFNVRETPLSTIADYSIIGKAEETLPIFVDTFLKRIE